MSEAKPIPLPDRAELGQRARALRTRFGEFRGRL
jgi:hypothetical protein